VRTPIVFATRTTFDDVSEFGTKMVDTHPQSEFSLENSAEKSTQRPIFSRRFRKLEWKPSLRPFSHSLSLSGPSTRQQVVGSTKKYMVITLPSPSHALHLQEVTHLILYHCIAWIFQNCRADTYRVCTNFTILPPHPHTYASVTRYIILPDVNQPRARHVSVCEFACVSVSACEFACV